MAGSPDDFSRADAELIARDVAREFGVDPVLVISGSRRVECRRARHRWRYRVAKRMGLWERRTTLTHVAEILRCDLESLRRSLRGEVFRSRVALREVARLGGEPRADVDARRAGASDEVSHVNHFTQFHDVTQLG
jgi:hypothetical protein